MSLTLTLAVWGVAVVGSLAALGTREPLDRIRILNLWVGGGMIWALTSHVWTPTQIAAGVILADALLSFVLIGVIVATRLARTLGGPDRA
jgi:energy-converting hydrogenase Eha subunit C